MGLVKGWEYLGRMLGKGWCFSQPIFYQPFPNVILGKCWEKVGETLDYYKCFIFIIVMCITVVVETQLYTLRSVSMFELQSYLFL